jgi:hypothetical protein
LNGKPSLGPNSSEVNEAGLNSDAYDEHSFRLTQARPISDRSLNLFLSDLEKFEGVSKDEAEKILSACRTVRSRKQSAWLRVRGNPNQLRLFEDF